MNKYIIVCAYPTGTIGAWFQLDKCKKQYILSLSSEVLNFKDLDTFLIGNLFHCWLSGPLFFLYSKLLPKTVVYNLSVNYPLRLLIYKVKLFCITLYTSSSVLTFVVFRWWISQVNTVRKTKKAEWFVRFCRNTREGMLVYLLCSFE